MLQLETAAGAAIRNFKGAVGINVPRRRFLPVKKTSDLLVVMSNLFMISEGSLRVNSKRSIGVLPLVKLGDKHFQKVDCNGLINFIYIPPLSPTPRYIFLIFFNLLTECR